VAQRIVNGTEEGLPMVSQPTVEKYAADAGLPPNQVDALVKDYGAAQVAALKRALLVASLLVLVGAWFARALPRKPLGARDAAEPATPEPRPAPA
jgi:hypothetical protein